MSYFSFVFLAWSSFTHDPSRRTCLPLPLGPTILFLQWIKLSWSCFSEAVSSNIHMPFWVLHFFSLLESDKLYNTSKSESLNKSKFLYLKNSLWCYAILGCHFSKENGRSRSLVYKLYESQKFLWAVFHVLDSKSSLQDWGSAGCLWSRHKTNIPKWLYYFSFKEPVGCYWS